MHCLPETRYIYFLLFVYIVCGIGTPSYAQSFAHAYPLVYAPIRAGERLEYHAGWNGIPAARISLSVVHDREYPGLLRIVAEARSLGYVALLWNMHDVWQTRIDAATYQPISFVVSMHENEWVDVRRGIFHYAEHVLKVERRTRHSEEGYTIPIQTTYDILSGLCLLRSIELSVGEARYAQVTDGKGTYLVTMNVTEKELVKVKAGSIPAYRMTVSLKKMYHEDSPSPAKQKFYGATLWIAADHTRVPLRIESKLFVGSVYLELVSDNRGLSSAYGRH